MSSNSLKSGTSVWSNLFYFSFEIIKFQQTTIHVRKNGKSYLSLEERIRLKERYLKKLIFFALSRFLPAIDDVVLINEGKTVEKSNLEIIR